MNELLDRLRELGSKVDPAQVEPTSETVPGRGLIFISYSQHADGHRQLVKDLSTRLSGDGFEVLADVDAFPLSEGWVQWARTGIRKAHAVLLLCSKVYRQDFEASGEGVGTGVVIEGRLVANALWENKMRNTKFIPVLPDYEPETSVPDILYDTPYFRFPSGYIELRNCLLGLRERRADGSANTVAGKMVAQSGRSCSWGSEGRPIGPWTKANVLRRLLGSGVEFLTFNIGFILIFILDSITAKMTPFLTVLLGGLVVLRDYKGGAFSIGKRVNEMRVIDRRTGRITSVAQALQRNCYYLALVLASIFFPFMDALGSVILLCFVVLDVMTILANPRGLRLGDFLAGTQVVEVRSQAVEPQSEMIFSESKAFEVKGLAGISESGSPHRSNRAGDN